MKYGQKAYRMSFIDSTASGVQWVADRMWKVEHAFERANAVTGERLSSARMRIFFILMVMGVIYVVLAGFAIKAAVSGGHGGVDLGLPADARADIVDRNGQMLATDISNFDLFIDPTDIMAADRPLVKRALIQLLPDVPRDTLDAAINGDGRTMVMRWLKPSDKARILSYGLPGVGFEAQRVRGYPLGETGGFYIGMTERAGKGLAGAERAFQDQIAGSSTPFMLAMDLRVQGALENELRGVAMAQEAKGAIGLVTNVRTGEVIAMASWPEFDPNAAGKYADNNKLNRVTNSVFEVGSVFKVLSVAIGLESGSASLNSVYDARTPYSIGKRKISDYHAENRLMTLEDVFLVSSNIGTTLMAESVGVDTMTKFYNSLGLFRAADIELAETASPLVPKKWSKDSLASSSFGHGMSISPLSYAQAAASTMNGGYLRPFTLRKYDGTSPLKGERVFSANTSRQMLDLMRVNVLKGTGGKANAPGLRVGGKTGSAEKVIGGRYDRSKLLSSFVGVFPTDGNIEDDRYMVMIMVDEPKGNTETHGLRTGGWVAAPVVGRVIDRIAPFLNVARKEDKFSDSEWVKAQVMPEEQTGGVVAGHAVPVAAGH
ncbi:penicillin-binding protein 2 [Asticcacaulis sp. BYS171W]|uniref:Penicillin-binding protein 2 n=1 Tax=Asticcacaulis aquaticus TaxID=2984212 RepID=A0ABT5HRS4_9CAUL|nr:penicillin-binding protein 2 [Asticcacaulis aquaticus]MDC7682535.1 penicillin-binding protein 2 [Asticcacaulis aquaticus]